MKHSNLASLVSIIWVAASCGGSSFTSAGSSDSTGGQAAAGGDSQGGAANAGGDPAVGGDTSVPPTSGTGGVANMTCDQLATAYVTDLAVAKQCTANSTTDHCTTKVKSTIGCGCVTFVNASRTAVIANLSKYIQAYNAQDCATACPAIACIEPTTASCSSSGSGGGSRCVDANATTN